ncbi:MAG: DUF3473 domain-containing protein [Candidatus Scalindua sp.]|nr:DUF3473 domain-containing protein [Candidatus Scalindua sp.]
MTNQGSIVTNYLTIDVEDYFQVSAFSNKIRFEDWGNYESRVVENTKKLLEILSKTDEIKGTFFILGWVAEKYPEIVKEIDINGHEVACHSYRHQLIYNISPDEFRRDITKAKNILEDITGKKILGYRAPSYSITRKSLWAFEILAEAGFEYDSSVFPITHDLYGMPDAPRFEYKLVEHDLVEYPITTSRLLGLNIPVSGGGYFRLFPYWFTRMALHKINTSDNQPFIFYLHPWEIDPEQPRIHGAKFLSRFRTYHNLVKTKERFGKLLKDFKFGPISPQHKMTETVA